MEQLFVFIIIGALALMKWLISDKGGSSNDDDAPRSPRDETSEEERMRRFMEALGVPKDSPPPRPQRRQLSRREVIEQQRVPRVKPVPPIIAPRPVAFPPTVFKPKKREVIREPEPEILQTPQPAPAYFPEPKVESIPVTTQIAPEVVPEFIEGKTAQPTAPRASFRALLQSPATLRDAMILREILGPPRALQEGLQTNF